MNTEMLGLGSSIVLGLFAFICVLMLVKWIVSLRVVVPTNMVHIVQNKKSTVPYGKGKDAGNIYYHWPSCIPFLGITVTEFPESIFQVNLEDYEAYDAARLPFKVDVTAFFKVNNAETVSQRVSSFAELKQQLVSVLQGSVRRILATNKLEDIMQERSALGEEFTKEIGDNINEWGVTPVKTIEFMDIRDASGSNVIRNIMAKESSRIDMESRMKVAENGQKAQIREVEAMKLVEVQKQEAEESVGLRTAEKEQNVGIAKEKANQQIKEEAKVTAEKEMEVKRVNDVKSAEIQKDVEQTIAEKEKIKAEINAEAIKNAQITKAQGEKESVVLTASGEMERAKLNAQGIEAEGKAKAIAEEAILMAPVKSQIELAKEIGKNDSYQKYLTSVKTIEAYQVVGKEFAISAGKAEMKVIATGGDVQSGMSNVMDIFTAKGGTNLSAMLTGLAQTPEGKNLLDVFKPKA